MLVMAYAAHAGQSMNGTEIEATFRGITLDGVYGDGTFFSETYFEDGTIRYHESGVADSGDWSVRDGLFCTFYEGLEGGCFFVFREGSNCFVFYGAVEGADGNPVQDESLTAHGWDRRSEATCQKPPAPAV